MFRSTFDELLAAVLGIVVFLGVVASIGLILGLIWRVARWVAGV